MTNLIIQGKFPPARVGAAKELIKAHLAKWNEVEGRRTQLLYAVLERDGSVMVDIRHENGRSENYRPDVYLGRV